MRFVFLCSVIDFILYSYRHVVWSREQYSAEADSAIIFNGISKKKKMQYEFNFSFFYRINLITQN